MGLLRLLLFAALVLLAWHFARVWLRARARAPRALVQGGAMLRCSHCGVHVPEREAVRSGERAFCSESHRDAHDSHGEAS